MNMTFAFLYQYKVHYFLSKLRLCTLWSFFFFFRSLRTNSSTTQRANFNNKVPNVINHLKNSLYFIF